MRRFDVGSKRRNIQYNWNSWPSRITDFVARRCVLPRQKVAFTDGISLKVTDQPSGRKMIESSSKEEFEAALARQASEAANSTPLDLSKSKGKINQLHVAIAMMVLFVVAVLASGFFQGDSGSGSDGADQVTIQVGQR